MGVRSLFSHLSVHVLGGELHLGRDVRDHRLGFETDWKQAGEWISFHCAQIRTKKTIAEWLAHVLQFFPFFFFFFFSSSFPPPPFFPFSLSFFSSFTGLLVSPDLRKGGTRPSPFVPWSGC